MFMFYLVEQTVIARDRDQKFWSWAESEGGWEAYRTQSEPAIKISLEDVITIVQHIFRHYANKTLTRKQVSERIFSGPIIQPQSE
jgi:hypothetical protein